MLSCVLIFTNEIHIPSPSVVFYHYPIPYIKQSLPVEGG